MALRGCYCTNYSLRGQHSLKKFLLLLIVVAFCLYAYFWRHYFALVLAPPSTFRPRHHYYHEMLRHVNVSQIEKLRNDLIEPLPKWVKEYASWHAQVRSSGFKNNNTKILLVSIEDHHSGGLADRLRSLPFLLWEAIRTERVFLIQWTNPCAMEEFLLPPLGGIDWTVPRDFDTSDAVWYIYDQHGNTQLTNNDAYKQYTLIKTWHNPWTFVGGMPLLAKALNVSTLSDPVFYQIYRLLLTPSPPVQQMMDDTMHTLGLKHQEYNGIHLRARYPGVSDAFQAKSSWFSRSVDADGFKWTPAAQQEVLHLVDHAVECLKDESSNKSLPIYFASDTNEAVKVVTREQNDVVGMVTPLEKMHLNRNDRVGLVRKTPPSAFYPAIVDLWILSQAKCIAVGAGGFGVFASILGPSDCIVFHMENSFVGDNAAKYCMEEKEP